ncbi:hypothetical protein HYX58_03710 [Candidatus Dependentiae bacterium]|nr:hypothetical protein [Candidatus Dependentiae bacterium]
MKLNHLLLFLTLCFNSFLLQAEKPVIIVPLDMFLLEPDVNAALSETGFSATGAWAGFKGIFKGDPIAEASKEMKHLLFDALTTIEKIGITNGRSATAHCSKAIWNGMEAPDAIYKLLFGLVSTAELLSTVENDIRRANNQLKTLERSHKIKKNEIQKIRDESSVLKLVRIAIDPATCTRSLQLCPEGEAFVRELAQNYRIVIADNYNQEVASALKTKFALLRTSDMVVSGDLKEIKSKKFYDEVLTRYKIDPANCYVIEKDPLYAEYAAQAGIPRNKMILCGHLEHAKRNVHDARKELREKHNIRI